MMMGNVRERTSEIGVFRAIGFRRKEITRVVRAEALFLSFAGGALGSAAGFALTFVLPKTMAVARVSIICGLFIALGGIAVSVAIAIIASVFRQITRAALDPAEALKTL